MDPDATLAEIRRLADLILNNGGLIDGEGVMKLAEQIQALDEWIMKSGFLPADWRK